MEHVLQALRLIEQRARGNGREEITLDDIEWAIQELERELEEHADILHAVQSQDAGQL